MRHEIDGQRSAGRIVVGAEITARLIDKPIDEIFTLQRLLIDRHFLGRRINLNAEFADDYAVYGDASAANEVVAAAP